MRALGCFTPEEIQFLSEDVSVDVVSNFSFAKGGTCFMIHGELPRFVAAFTQTLPVWVAVSLKKQGKCSLVREKHTTQSSYWWKYLCDHELNRLLRIERGVAFPQTVAFWAFDISERVCETFNEDLTEWQRVNDLLIELRNLRRQKLRKFLRNQVEFSQGVYLNDYTAAELNFVRKFVVMGFLE